MDISQSAVRFSLFLLILLVTFDAISQTYGLGSLQLVQRQKPNLLLSKSNFGSPRFYRSVGGVDFHQVATLSSALEGVEIEIQYNEKKADGYRLQITIDDNDYHPFIPDWQLVPITHFSNDLEHTSIVSLFGKAIDPTNTQIVYHPAFIDNLLGLRLLHADFLLNSPHEYWQMPTENNVELLGSGEKPPLSGVNHPFFTKKEMYENVARMISFQMNSIADEEGAPTSWVFTDYNTPVRIDIQCDTLNITGEPYFLFHAVDMTAYIDIVGEELKRIEESKIQYDNDTGALLAEITSEQEFCKIYSDTIAAVTYRLETLHKAFEEKRITEEEFKEKVYPVFGHKTKLDRQFQQFSDGLFDLIQEEENKAILTEHQSTRALAELSPIYTKHKITYVLRNIYPELINRINPNVYQASKNTMQFAAFFRYIKASNPDEWDQFLQQIEQVKYMPNRVFTPDHYVLPPDEKN